MEQCRFQSLCNTIIPPGLIPALQSPITHWHFTLFLTILIQWH